MTQRLTLLALFAAMVGASVYGHFTLPERVPMQYGLDGEPNWYGPRWVALIITPILAVLIPAFFALMPRLDPLTRRDPSAYSYASFSGTLRRWAVWVVALLTFVHIFVIAASTAVDRQLLSRLLLIAVSILFIALGNEMGRLRPNSFAGIRMPWLMKNPEAWRITHRFGGKVMFAAGVLGVLFALTLPTAAAGITTMVMILGSIFVPVIYSYRVAQRTPVTR